MMKKLAVLGLVWGIVGVISAQTLVLSARFETLTPSVRIGEPFVIELVVRVPTDAQVTFLEREYTLWQEPLELLDTQAVRVEPIDGGVKHSLPLEVVVWSYGELFTPAMNVEVRTTPQTDPILLTAAPMLLTVESVLDEVPELKIARGVFDLRYLPLIWLILGGLLISALLTLFIWRGAVMVRARMASAGALQQRLQRTIAERTLQTLRRLPQDAPDEAQLYAMLGDQLRHYLAERYHLSAEYTTQELTEQLKASQILPEQRARQLFYMLAIADLAKYAPAEDFKNIIKQDPLEMAVQWVKAVELIAVEKQL